MKSVITMLFVITTLATGYSVTAAVQAGAVESAVESSGVKSKSFAAKGKSK